MDCPKCGKQCGRDEVHNGVAMLYGPWGCMCGWSEWEEYDMSEGQRSRLVLSKIEGYITSTVGFIPIRSNP